MSQSQRCRREPAPRTMQRQQQMSKCLARCVDGVCQDRIFAVDYPTAGMEEAVIFRATPAIATQLREACRGDRTDVAMAIECTDEGTGEYKVTITIGDAPIEHTAFLGTCRCSCRVGSCCNFRSPPTVDLPCIVEVQKTADHQMYYKSGNITKVYWCRSQRPAPLHHPPRTPQALVLVPAGSSLQDVAKIVETPNGLHTLDSGITPPTAHIVQRRFRPAAKAVMAGAEPQSVAILEQMLTNLSEADTAHSKQLLYEDVVLAEDYMEEWPGTVTVEYRNGEPAMATPLTVAGGPVLDATEWLAAKAAGEDPNLAVAAGHGGGAAGSGPGVAGTLTEEELLLASMAM